MTPAPPPVPVIPGDLVAWRRSAQGVLVAHGFGIVVALDGAVVVVHPITGSTSHQLRRPPADVLRLVSHAQLVTGLEDEFRRLGHPSW